MDSRTCDLLYALSLALEEDSRCKELREVEERLNLDQEVISLSEKAKEKLSEYAYAKDHFGENSELTKERQHELFLAKKALDEHPLSKEYQRKYVLVRNLYDKLDSILLSPYREKRKCEVRG